jgi:hypothetical protein
MFDFARRAAVTGKLYCLKVNAGGNVWHFSSSFAAAERKTPENFPSAQQKHWSFDKAAEILINQAFLRAN